MNRNRGRRVQGYEFEPEYAPEELEEIRNRAEVARPLPIVDVDIGRIRENCACDGGCIKIPQQFDVNLENGLKRLLIVNDLTMGVVCCHQIPDITRFLNRHPNQLGDPKCITENPNFKTMCLNKVVLETFYKSYLHYRKLENSNRPVAEQLSNRTYRYTGYRDFVHMIYERLWRNNRRMLPLCVLLRIRLEFPEENVEDYVGYKRFGVPEDQHALD